MLYVVGSSRWAWRLSGDADLGAASVLECAGGASA